MIKNLISNWRTTSAGLALIVTSTVHLYFMVRSGAATENTWTTALLADITGAGLLFAGDSAISASKVDLSSTRQDVAKAVETNDTTLLRKTDPPKP